MNIYTAGYSTHTPAELKAAAERLNAVVFDIRYSPRSRQPDWRALNMSSLLGVRLCSVPEWGNINYLGNCGEGIQIADFDAGLSVLRLYQATGLASVILLCACKEPDGCHRTVIAEKLFFQHGYSVEEMKW